VVLFASASLFAIVLLVVHHAVGRHLFSSSRAATVAVVENALPRIREVSALRGEIRALRSELLQACWTAPLAASDGGGGPVPRTLAVADSHWVRYRALPARLPG